MQTDKKKSFRVLAAAMALVMLLLFLTVFASAEPVDTAAPQDTKATTDSEELTDADDQVVPAPTEAPVTEAPTEPATEAPVEAEPETEAPPETVETPPEQRNMFRLTPDGSPTLIDDFEYLVDVDGTLLSKQFITVQSRDGSYFYIIIDRNGEAENVYFLNQVDLADLKALVSGETQTIPETECTCTTTCVPGSINMSCPVCATNMAECAAVTAPGKEAEKEDEKKDNPPPTEATEPKDNDDPPSKKTMNPYLALGLIVVIIVGVLVYFFRGKHKGRKERQLSEYDFDEDEDELETEPAPKEEKPAPAAERQQPSDTEPADPEEDYEEEFDDETDLM